jgi:hypothetical protein
VTRLLPLLLLTGCATFGQKPLPVGEPGPLACISAKSAEQAWLEIDAYMKAVLAAQEAYSCSPLAPAVTSDAWFVPPVVPPLR